MKITLKTLKQQTYIVEVDMEKDTVLSLKEKLCVESGQAYPVERQWLIYLGKIMEDEQLLSQYNVDDKKFIVVMNKKTAKVDDGESATDKTSVAVKDVKVGKDSKSDDSPAASASASSSQSKASSSPGTTEKLPAKEETTSQESEPTPVDDTAADMQANIRRITEMGYPEQNVRMALEICANDPDRAVEFLLSTGSVAQMMLRTPAATTSASGESRGSNRLAFLRNHPVFQDMRRLLQENPTLLPHLMQRIQTSNPGLMQIIVNNQEEFLELINEPQRENMSHELELEDIATAMVNNLTPSDMDAIDRLKALGYPEYLVIQAYFACERDEYHTAEFLVSMTQDTEE